MSSLPASPPPSAVVKLGGSLLDLADLVQRLTPLGPEWGPRPVLVVGGGTAADLVREWDRQQQLGEERAHWLALDALDLTSRLVESLWSPARVTRIADMERAWEQEWVPLVSAREWFEAALKQGTPTPPHRWETTTDTIAAWIASLTNAESLWLLKSVPCPVSLTEATDQGSVDPQFVAWVPAQMPVRWVNLRETPAASTPCWLTAAG